MKCNWLQYIVEKQKISKGFTLTEMLIVIALVSIISAIAMPYCIRYQEKQRIKSALRSVFLIVVNSRMASYKANSAVVITFDATRCLAFLDNGDGRNGIAKDWQKQSEEKVVGEFIATPGIRFNNNFPKKDMFRFCKRVGVTPGTITVFYNDKAVGKVVVNITGRPRIEML